ncbi:MAG: hypothetical protein KatS3mg076_1704 [Candidatus Binatia bacterium]|nr:MAG: hypothetical protein KatS3mg076_1704 [Candidatus Binatia bacterium]
MSAKTDIAILQEIVRVIQRREQVPDRVRVRNKSYQIIYLDDHRQRLEEALRRRDRDRLAMLFGQLTGRVKYQLLRPRTRRGRANERAASRRGS